MIVIIYGFVESFDGVKHIKLPSQIKLTCLNKSDLVTRWFSCISFRRKFDSGSRYEADDEAQVLMD